MWKIDRGSLVGTTAADYVNALGWKTHDLGAKTLLLRNADASSTLKYKLSGCAAEGGITCELVPETVLGPGEAAEFHYDRQWHALKLSVKDGTGHAAYALDYEGQGA
jgi:hypothetical protein